VGMKLWGQGILVAGVGSLLLVALTGCVETNPDRVAVVDRAVEAIAPASLGKVICDETTQNHDLMTTVPYERTIAVAGAGKDAQMIDRLNGAGFKISDGSTTAGGYTWTQLKGPKAAEASVYSAKESFGLDNDGTNCVVPKQGVTVVTFDL
jgi:hypothetical protein